MDKYSKNSRTLDLYVRFCEGKTIHKAAEAERFGVNERSVQRDIDDIRAFWKREVQLEPGIGKSFTIVRKGTYNDWYRRLGNVKQ